MLDLVALAFACDQTRSASFMLGRGFSSLEYSDLLFGGTGQWHHHSITHQLGDPLLRDRHDKICRWEIEQFAYLVKKLRDIDEGGVSILDNSVITLASDVSDGHSHSNMPILVAGGAGGAFNPGRHVRYSGGPPMPNLWAAILNALGGNVQKFGDSGTGILGQL
jgi:hypothetical protein